MADTVWGRVVESDQIYSPKLGRWCEVIRVTPLPLEKVEVYLAGIKTPIVRPSGLTIEPDKFRRGQTGKVVDMFAVIFSGPTEEVPR